MKLATIEKQEAMEREGTIDLNYVKYDGRESTPVQPEDVFGEPKCTAEDRLETFDE